MDFSHDMARSFVHGCLRSFGSLCAVWDFFSIRARFSTMGFLRHGGSLSLHGFLITFGSLAMPWIEVISDFLARSVVRGFLRAAGSLTRPGVSDLILARSFRLVFTDFWARSRNNGFLMYSGSLL